MNRADTELIRERSVSHLSLRLWTDSGLKSGISFCKLISTLKRKKVQAENELSKHSPIILASTEKATTYDDQG